MKPFLAAILAAAFVVGTAAAQEQEEGLLERIFSKSKTDETDPMQNKQFGGTNRFASEEFQSATFDGVKPAETKDYTTRSFFGVKNPWFGNKIFDAPTDKLSQKSDGSADKTFSTADFLAKSYETGEDESRLAETRVPTALEPREFAVFDPRSRQSDSTQEMQGFVNNLSQDLSIEDVRALLNKGQDTQ